MIYQNIHILKIKLIINKIIKILNYANKLAFLKFSTKKQK